MGGFIVASASGVGIALAVTNDSVNALVGVAISAALLPPLVNAFLCLTLGSILSLYQFNEKAWSICNGDTYHLHYIS